MNHKREILLEYQKTGYIDQIAKQFNYTRLEIYQLIKNSLIPFSKSDQNYHLENCIICDKQMLVWGSSNDPTCSEKCEKISSTRNCAVCGKEFIAKNNQKTCSQACATVLNRNNTNYDDLSSSLEKTQKTCDYCGGSFIGVSNSKYCSKKCRLLANTNPDYYSVFYRDHFRCRYCGRTPADNIKLTIDHVYPKSKGGKEEKINLVTACQNCNSHKSDKKWSDERIKEIWWENKKLAENTSDKSYKEILSEFKEEYSGENIPILLGGKKDHDNQVDKGISEDSI